ncbi:hypothetical protein GCM10008023_18390 [Sphingomonas glacialis]|uniref:TonB C-terminal domain-containing protein n=1 Tax=Sphingomonas glacialis TaxID=658225 RepID=A0ABQ3LHE0_9SPHN|nr:hypothetical protein [Sphingomonas glacialis]GHH15456.1 hypothetical protein GCM10008023_18390 [Sphingomonas glacialis]
MILFMLLLQAAELPAVPADWATLAPLPYVAAPRLTPQLTSFVASEITANRCPMAKPADGHYVVKVDVATLVGADGIVRRTVPHAINCPTVEQYAAGLVTGFARGNLALRAGTTDHWYRATIVFDWRE